MLNNPYIQTPAPDSFVSVQNEHEARIYPVAPGKSVTFRDESQPTIFYTKTGGASPLDAPVFEKYKLVKEETPAAIIATETAANVKDIDLSIYAEKDEIRALHDAIEAIQKDIASLKKQKDDRIGGKER
jgi:hypothetical protein